MQIMLNRAKILLLFDNVGTEYVSRIEKAAVRQGQLAGAMLRSVNVFGTDELVSSLLEADNWNGVILTPPLSDDRVVLKLIEQRGIPFVRLAPLLDLDRGSSVLMDEYEAARAITDLLLQRGHRRVGFVRGPRVHLVSMRRFNGYANALGRLGLRVDPSLVVVGDFSRESGRAVAPTLFAQRPTAIFASNDDMAAGVIDAANEVGIAIPGELSLVGFDDNVVARTSRPGLTSLRQPLEEMAETACTMLIERIRNPRLCSAHETVPFQIVERSSVAEPAGI